jgi:two-component system, NarL family, sensor kinase
MHRTVQGWVDRLLYGDRDAPLRALRQLGAQLEAVAPDDVPQRIVDTVQQATRSPWVRLDLPGGVAAEVGASRGVAESEVVILSHAGTSLGRLLVQPRPGERRLPSRERMLLEDLGRQAGVALYAARATTELLASREHLVRAREAERARLRRDLHDGLSPALAGISLAAHAAAPAVRADPDLAEQLLDQMANEAQSSGESVQRLLADLRPLQLEELGLVAAIEEHAAHLACSTAVRVTSDAMPVLPAAVEVAAYRIAVEAITNAARHADARTIAVHLSGGRELEVKIEDDGSGIAAHQRPGVGMASMRERAEGVGGVLRVAPRPGGGTVVTASLPVNGLTT